MFYLDCSSLHLASSQFQLGSSRGHVFITYSLAASSSLCFPPSWFSQTPSLGTQEPHLSLFCPAIGWRHLYLTNRFKLRSKVTLGILEDFLLAEATRPWGSVFSITTHSNRPNLHTIHCCRWFAAPLNVFISVAVTAAREQCQGRKIYSASLF